MNIETLKQLGLDTNELGNRVVDQAVEALLSSSGFDPDSEQETSYESKFKREIQKRIQESVDQKITALASEHLMPKIGDIIENANLQKTNQFGERKGDPLTFIEYMAERAENYMTENVNSVGESKAETRDTYNWRAAGPRISVLMKMHIHSELEKHAKAAVSDINKVIAENIKKAAIDAISSAQAAIKIGVSV